MFVVYQGFNSARRGIELESYGAIIIAIERKHAKAAAGLFYCEDEARRIGGGWKAQGEDVAGFAAAEEPEQRTHDTSEAVLHQKSTLSRSFELGAELEPRTFEEMFVSGETPPKPKSRI